MAEIIKCPSCQRQLQVPENFAGQKVQCPKCAATFVAGAPAGLPAAPREAVERTTADWEPPPRERRRGHDDYDDDYGDDYEDRYTRRDYLPHRGTAVLTLGILSLVICWPILGPIAWIMGNSDLKEIRSGRMDPEGEGYTNAGRICGIVATCVGYGLVCVWLIFIVAAAGAGGFRFR
jgi:hypothetical protein